MLLALLYALLGLLIELLILRGRRAADRDLELLVLRQELLVLRRTTPRPRWRTADRLILAALGRKLSAGALLLVQPATVLGWHRALVHRRWAAFGRRRGPGRPKLSAECRGLVLRLARENPLWGYERIRGELLQLGHRVSSTSIRNPLRRHRIPPAPRRAGLTWRRFLQAHGRATLACDYFTVDTVFLRRLYVLFFLELASRRILFTACSEHPGGVWAAQQARNLAWQLQEAEVRPRFLIHDRDGNFPAAFDAVFRAEGLEVIRTPVRAPNANARCERWVSSVRRECLDWLMIVGRWHPEVVLAEYVEHYKGPHRSLELRPPRGPTVLPRRSHAPSHRIAAPSARNNASPSLVDSTGANVSILPTDKCTLRAPSPAARPARAGPKRWTGVGAGWAIELRNQESGVPMPCLWTEGKIAGGRTIAILEGRSLAYGGRVPDGDGLRRDAVLVDGPGAVPRDHRPRAAGR